MEKQGYKQTEVGLIPEDWNVYRFEDLGDTIIGLTYKPVDVNITGKLVHRSSNIQNNKLAYHDNVYVTCHIPEKLILRKDDILICVRNGSRDLIGKSAIIQGISIGETFGAFMSVFRPRIYPPLVYQYFISNIVQSQINASLGATINQITNKTLNSFITVFPTNLKEQKAIATALSEVDELIANLDQLITKKKAIKQGAMQQLLTPPHKGGKRLEGFSGEWVEKKVNEVYSTIIDNRGKTPPYNTDDDIKLIETASISFVGQSPDYSKVTKYVSKETYNNWFRGHPQKNDILISTVGEYSGASAILKESIGTIAQNLIAIRPKNINPLFFFYWTRSNSYKKQLKEVMMGHAQPSLKVTWLIYFQVDFPSSIEEQIAIAEILSDMDKEIEQLETKKAKYQNIKQGMMQELLTGKTRLI